MFKVRFNLSAGVNFQKWQVKSPSGVTFYNPAIVSLVMSNCRLKNHGRTAQRIHAGENKRVCAWIECDNVEIIESSRQSGFPICYNPRKLPYWTDVSGRLNLDNHEFHKIISIGRSLIMPSNLRVPSLTQWQQTRRSYLIKKQIANGINPEQQSELDELQRIACTFADQVAPIDESKSCVVFSHYSHLLSSLS